MSCFAEWSEKKKPGNGREGWLPQGHGEVVERNNQPNESKIGEKNITKKIHTMATKLSRLGGLSVEAKTQKR